MRLMNHLTVCDECGELERDTYIIIEAGEDCADIWICSKCIRKAYFQLEHYKKGL